MLELKEVSKYYHNEGVTNKGLINVNLKLNRNEIVVITGESGSGKSTLLNVITKQDTFDEGEIYYLGNETSFFSVDDMDEFRKNKIGFIFQNYNIIDSYTVLENVMLPLIINGVSYKEAKAEAMEIIKKVGLEKWAHNRGTKLSGGQKQRCVIARALASRCEILACDEPTGNLDSKTGDEIVELIKEVAADKLVLIVTHNYDQFAPIATRKIKVHDGEITEDSIIEHSEVVEDDKELDLEYKPVAFKTDARIALNNLKSTPRKTLLMSLIIFFTAIFAMFLYQSISSNLKDLYKENVFIYQGDNKIIAYDNLNHNTIDMSKLSGYTHYEVDEFSLDDEAMLVTYGEGATSNYVSGGCYEACVKNLVMISGEMPKEDNEFLFVVGKSYSKKEALREYNDIKDAGDLSVMSQYYWNPKSIKLSKALKCTGVAKSEYIEDYSRCITGRQDSPSTYLSNVFRIASMVDELNVNLYNIVIDNSVKTSLIPHESQGLPTPKYLDNDHAVINLEKLNATATETSIEQGTLTVGYDFKDYLNVYEVSLYGDASKLKNMVEKQKLSYIDIHNYDSSTALMRFIMNIASYISIFTSSWVVLLIYLITSIILLKVFSSKMEAYAIFRTLGVTKNDMKKILRIEVMFLVITISIFNYVMFFILGKALWKKVALFKMFRSIGVAVTLLYFVVMLLIGLLMARKFNKKLFKSSVSKTLRESD